MPADPLAPVSPGDDALSTALSAASQNALREAARRVRGGWPRGDPRGGSPLIPSLEVIVRNDSGGDLDAFAVVSPTGTEVSPSALPFEVQARPAFAAAAPAADTDPVFILAEPAPEDALVRAVAIGVTLVYVNLSDTDHDYAEPAAGATATLASSHTGPARILWRAGSLGSSVLCVVLLTGSGASSGSGPGTCLTVVTNWTCVAGVATVTKKTIWLPPGAEVYDVAADCTTAHPGA